MNQEQLRAKTLFKLLKARMITWDTMSEEDRNLVLRAYPHLAED